MPSFFAETLRPTRAVRDPADGKARMLVVAYPPEPNIERPVLDKHGKASPAPAGSVLVEPNAGGAGEPAMIFPGRTGISPL